MTGMTSFQDMMRVHGAALARVVASYAPPGPDREELAQEVALALVTALPRHRGESSLKTYVLRIAHNVSLRHAVRRRAANAVPFQDIADDRACAYRVVAAAGERNRLHAAIRLLPLAQRQVLALALEDLSHVEIAATLGITDKVRA
jgi:RNA polymerase sigma-70 factor (ECF subfamily)